MEEFDVPKGGQSPLNGKTPVDAKPLTGNGTSASAASTPCNCPQTVKTVYVPVPVAPKPKKAPKEENPPKEETPPKEEIPPKEEKPPEEEKPPKRKKDKGKKIKPEKDDEGPRVFNPPFNIGISVGVPIGPKRRRPDPSDYPRDDPKNPGRDDKNPGRDDKNPGKGNKNPGRDNKNPGRIYYPGRIDYPGSKKPPRGDSGSSSNKPPSNRLPGGVIFGRPSRIGIRPNIQVVKPPPPRQVIK
jgi:hypothetical protein